MSMRTSIASPIVAASVLVLASAAGALAQVQSSGQQKCLNAVNKGGTAVFKTQGKESLGCLRAAGKGTLVGTAQACLTADAKGKVLKAKNKTVADDTKSCTPPPDFGYTAPATINGAAQQAELDLTADVYGANLDAAVISCATNKPGCVCQQKISKLVEQLAATKLAIFLACKKATLKAGAISAAALRDCVNDAGTVGSIAADSKGKIAKTLGKLANTTNKGCDGTTPSAGAYPGACSAALNGTALAGCLDTQIECRVCQAINEIDGLFVNCDLFDDGLANATCASGTGPTPTPTPTLTPTPTVTATPDGEFAGAIAKTSGLWNYDGVNGLLGGELECNDHFPTSHVCEYSELLIAEGNGELVGATDVNALAVTSFWAVDHTPGVPTDNAQCISTSGTIRWFYATAHTASNASFVDLNNGTGALGPLNSGTIECASAMKSVGCCY